MLDANYFNLSTFAEEVENAAGDYVIWDGRLVHRSTEWGPDAPSRLAMFMTVARSTANYQRFIAHLEKRAIGDQKLGRAAEALPPGTCPMGCAGKIRHGGPEENRSQ